MEVKEFVVKEEKELESVAKYLLNVVNKMNDMKKDRSCGATVLSLHGDLGSGKTTFMQIFALLLGIIESVTSPTFTIMKSYSTGDILTYKKLIHIDAYRIESIDEMKVLGFESLLAEKSTIIGIEWGERISELLPSGVINLTFEIIGKLRKITISY